MLRRAKSLRGQQTDAEQRLWYHLRAHRFQDLKFKRQKPIGSCIVDFVCIERGLVVEVDGGQHGDQSARDEARSRHLAALGYRVLRFWNDDVLCRTEAVLEQIRMAVEASDPLPTNLSPTGGRGQHKDG